MKNDLETVLAGIAELRDEVHELREALGERRKPDAADVELLSEIFAAVGSRIFNSREICTHARLPECAALHGALLRCVPQIEARRIGWRLKSMEGVRLGDLILDRIGTDRDGALWCLRVCQH